LEELLFKTYRAFPCLLLSTLLWGQAANPTSSEVPQKATADSSAPAVTPEAKAPEATSISADAPVITIQGICGNPPADKANASDCKTVVTRAEFEKLVDALAPAMPPPARRQLATRYATALAMAYRAHQLGLDQGPKFEERLKAARISTLADLLNQDIQEKASQVPDADIEDYYRKHIDVYQEADLQRLYIPHTKLLEPAKEKLSEVDSKKRQQEAEDAMKKEAEALRARAVAGEDFDKLQEEAFLTAGQKGKAPSTKMGKIRRTGLPPEQASVMDLKPNEVSSLISNPNGYFIYKMVSKDTLPLAKVRDEILNVLRSQRLQESMQALQQSSTTVLDDKYFAASAAASPGTNVQPGRPTLRGGTPPPTSPPTAGPK
jgi:hypothetical protein